MSLLFSGRADLGNCRLISLTGGEEKRRGREFPVRHWEEIFPRKVVRHCSRDKLELLPLEIFKTQLEKAFV